MKTFKNTSKIDNNINNYNYDIKEYLTNVELDQKWLLKIATIVYF